MPAANASYDHGHARRAFAGRGLKAEVGEVPGGGWPAVSLHYKSKESSNVRSQRAVAGGGRAGARRGGGRAGARRSGGSGVRAGAAAVGAGQGRLRVCEPHRRCRVDVPARPGPEADGGGARQQGADEIRRERGRGARRRARDPRARAKRQRHHLHDELRLHEPDREGVEAVSQGQVRARDRLQDRAQHGELQRALLRRPLSDGHHRRQDDEDQRPGIRGRVPHPGGAAGNQCIRPRRPQCRSRCARRG